MLLPMLLSTVSLAAEAPLAQLHREQVVLQELLFTVDGPHGTFYIEDAMGSQLTRAQVARALYPEKLNWRSRTLAQATLGVHNRAVLDRSELEYSDLDAMLHRQHRLYISPDVTGRLVVRQGTHHLPPLEYARLVDDVDAQLRFYGLHAVTWGGIGLGAYGFVAGGLRSSLALFGSLFTPLYGEDYEQAVNTMFLEGIVFMGVGGLTASGLFLNFYFNHRKWSPYADTLRVQSQVDHYNSQLPAPLAALSEPRWRDDFAVTPTLGPAALGLTGTFR